MTGNFNENELISTLISKPTRRRSARESKSRVALSLILLTGYASQGAASLNSAESQLLRCIGSQLLYFFVVRRSRNGNKSREWTDLQL